MTANDGPEVTATRMAVGSGVGRRTTLGIPPELADVLDAVAFLQGEKPHRTLCGMVEAALTVAGSDPDVSELVRARRRERSPLRVVPG